MSRNHWLVVLALPVLAAALLLTTRRTGPAPAQVVTAPVGAAVATPVPGRKPPLVVPVTTSPAPGPPGPRGPGCATPVRRGVLPVWARTGFSAKRPRMPYVLGREGRIAAILWGDMIAPPREHLGGNKILWAARDPVEPLSDLEIVAELYDAHGDLGRPQLRTVAGGPGPSGLDLPVAGCWRLTLRWSGRRDTLDLRYVNG